MNKKDKKANLKDDENSVSQQNPNQYQDEIHLHRPEHSHSHQHTKAVVNRLSRAIGHLESVKQMVEDGRDCSEVLIQIAAVRSAINNVGKVILQDHINHCVVDAIEKGNTEVLEDLNTAIDRFIK